MSNSKYLYNNDRASICQWELSFSFILKEQVVSFLNEYMKENIPLTFEYWEESSEQPTKYCIIVSGCWAHNLTRLSQLLEKYDFSIE